VRRFSFLPINQTDKFLEEGQMSLTEDKKQDQRIEAAKSALEWSKQILTLATGTLVLSGTFIKDIFRANIVSTGWILACWILMCVSILFGLIFLGATVNLLNSKEGNQVDVYSKRWWAIFHVLAFLIGLGCFVYFVNENLGNINIPPPIK
jgi:hypothetical protein